LPGAQVVPPQASSTQAPPEQRKPSGQGTSPAQAAGTQTPLVQVKPFAQTAPSSAAPSQSLSRPSQGSPAAGWTSPMHAPAYSPFTQARWPPRQVPTPAAAGGPS